MQEHLSTVINLSTLLSSCMKHVSENMYKVVVSHGYGNMYERVISLVSCP
uniref:Uncharacterized protein n=1 Tax=Arion vulgaris TaxID=1028688 RepID=A0A0B7B3Q4_9EUPU